MILKYAQRITWTKFDGSTTSIEVVGEGNKAMDDIIASAVDIAKQSGWTYPKWWQWWRWKDTHPRLSTGKPATDQDES